MKLQFTKEEFALFESNMIDNGFIKTNNKLNNEDYYLYKGLEYVEDREDEKPRKSLMLILSVYDLSKYERCRDITPLQIEANVMISRNVYERLDIVIGETFFESIEELESICRKYYQLTCEIKPL